jgi:hypothetical protein
LRIYVKMKRREFIKTTVAAAIALTAPMSLSAEVYKYPLIGQPLLTGLFKTDIFEKYVKDRIASKIQSVTPGHNYIEVVIKKNPYGKQNLLHSIPHAFAHGAYTIVDMETFTILKSREGATPKYLTIPDSANVKLVMENRRKIDDLSRTS